MPLAKNAGFSTETIRFDTAPMVNQAYAAAVAYHSFKASDYAPGSGWDVLRGQRP